MSDQVVDVLVVGGGPGGTAAAFRASELGLSTLVIDYDDLMKRIRDYSKDKLILPGFGGGDRMAFPAGGELIDGLRFGPIDKDDMCERWKALYRQHAVPARIGLELTGLVREGEVWRARAWDHRGHSEEELVARHVVLCIGRGVPRRFDIPGNTDGVAFRLSDPLHFVGGPACVIGGGTSAAEAVIAISNAKIRAEDTSDVYWSYRGDKMPRVSRALAERFFEAYVGNGNIRYYRHSEPAAVVVGDDRREYLAVRVDRRALAGRPFETTLLEFPKQACLACIGEDLPEELLSGLGVPMVVGGARGKKRMLVNRYLETAQPNLYMVGDILSQAYLEAEDFAADPATFTEVKHRGNIKTALRDGVRVAQVIHQRMQGVAEVDIAVGDAEELAAVEEVSSVIAQVSGTHDLRDARDASTRAQLIQLLTGGVQAEEYPLAAEDPTTIGRVGCSLVFPDDPALSDRHAVVLPTDDGWVLRDEGGATGVFLMVPSSHKIGLVHGDLLAAGRQFLVVEETEAGAALKHFDPEGQPIERYPLGERTLVVGRDAPDIVLDAQDLGLSRRHLAFSVEQGKVLVKDLKSLNGTLLRVQGEAALEHGSCFRVGQQTFALSLDPEDALDTAPPPAPRASSVELPLVAQPAAGPPASGPSVTFRGHAGPLGAAGKTVCDVAEENGVALVAECHSGICGSDPVRIVAGAENVEGGPSDGESETLEDLCDLEPGPCRLACMLRVKGPVEVEIL